MKIKRHFKLPKTNEEGMSLLEVLVAGSIGLVVAFTVAKAAVNANQAARSSELDLAYVAMMNRIENAIDDSVLCPSLWYHWDGSAFVAPTFDPGTTVTIHRLVDGAPTDVARVKTQGGPTVGLTVDSMEFSEPVQVSNNTYDWTFKIQTTKVAAGGGSFPGNVTTIRRIRLSVTTTDGPGYTPIYCGPPVSPEANQQAPLLRFDTSGGSTNCNDADSAKDSTCSAEFGPMYVVAGLQDLVQFRMFFSTNAGTIATPFRFSVANNTRAFSNSNSGTGARAPGTIYDVDTAGTCQVACIRNTAPLRFTRDFFSAGVANKTALCQVHVGFAYVAAVPNDLMRYGFKIQNTGITTSPMGTNAPGAVFEGGNACLLAWPTAASGPIMDCDASISGNPYPLACVLR